MADLDGKAKNSHGRFLCAFASPTRIRVHTTMNIPTNSELLIPCGPKFWTRFDPEPSIRSPPSSSSRLRRSARCVVLGLIASTEANAEANVKKLKED